MEIKSELLEGYSNVYALNGFSLQDKPFYKYIPLSRFEKSIEDKKLVFVRPKLWRDPFEKIYYKADYTRHSYTVEDVACLCVTYSGITNEEASWKMYSINKEEGGIDAVRVSFNKDAFLTLLNDYCRNNNCNAYIGNVIYKHNTNEIKKIWDSSSPLHYIYCPSPMFTHHYLSLLLLKRKSFAYEKEIRIFILRNGETSLGLISDKDLLEIPCKYSKTHLVDRVTLAPYEPLPNDKTEKMKKLINKINQIKSEQHKEMFSKLLGIDKASIKQSLLYKEQKKHIIIE